MFKPARFNPSKFKAFIRRRIDTVDGWEFRLLDRATGDAATQSHLTFEECIEELDSKCKAIRKGPRRL
jgi:hypothetical protein